MTNNTGSVRHENTMNVSQMKRWIREEGECGRWFGEGLPDLNVVSKWVTGRYLPEGKTIRVTCCSGFCFNPSHWELTDLADNAPEPTIAIEARPSIQILAEKIKEISKRPDVIGQEKVRLCRKGHEISGHRCKVCFNQYQAEFMRKRRSL